MEVLFQLSSVGMPPSQAAASAIKGKGSLCTVFKAKPGAKKVFQLHFWSSIVPEARKH